MPLTEAQERAIHVHDQNLVVVAGAGSGKTFVLVERYLSLLERNPAWPLASLVAITFTRKAAGEMRDRVRKDLQKRADGGGEGWAQRLAAMDSARIDTIHGLCTAILRGNAAEAGVDPGFEVLDEVEAAALLDDVLDDTFRSLSTSDPARELFAEYGERQVRDGLRRLIADETEPPSGDLFVHWLAQWVEDARTQVAAFLDWCGASDFWLWPGEIPAGDKLGALWLSCVDLARRIDAEPLLAGRLEALEALKSAIDLRVGSAAAWGGKETLQAAKSALRTLREAAAETLEAAGEPPGPADQRAAYLLPLWAAFAARARDAYRAARDDRGALDFDDLERLTRDLLRDHDDIAARYRSEFNHVLVDEFQDTNAAQWAIIRAIAPPDQPGRLFVVGDPKQSIYGFRGADVSVFEHVRGEIGAQVDLDRSFRTHLPLISCFNDLFAQLLVRDPSSPVAAYQVEFAAMQAERETAPCDDPALELLLFDKGNLPDEKEDQAARRWEARALARRIKALVGEGRLIYDRKAQDSDPPRPSIRPLGYGDVALLFQAMTHVTLYEAALKAEGIPYLTVAGKGYYDRQEVWDLLNLLRALYNPADNLALAAALRSPLFSLSDDALLSLRLLRAWDGRSLTLWQALDQSECVPPDEIEAVVFARDTLYGLSRQAGRVTVAELLRRALDATGYLAALTGLPDGARRRGNVEKLIDKAETSGRLTLGAFTQYLDDLSASETREGEATLDAEGVVRLMTVHASKGLEFPVVALADAQHERRGGASESPVDGQSCKVYDADKDTLADTYAYRRARRLERARDDAERRRVLYVAATRAQDVLLISGQVSRKPDKGLSASGWLGQLIGALGLRDIEPEPQVAAYPWGEARIDFPAPIQADDYAPPDAANWDRALPDEPPPLLARVEVETPLRSLTARQLGELGSALVGGSEALERWRQSVYHAAPVRIEQVGRAAPKDIGEIVHQALRWPSGEDDSALEATLRRYAWEQGIVDAGENRDAVEQALSLLTRVRRSDLFAEIERARVVYRQMPFVYTRHERSIHGVIDLLAQGVDGSWRVVDYKTNWLGESVAEADLAEHARRYHLQMSVYAAAVRELVGSAPLVHIHYIRYANTVTIHGDEWNAALGRLDHDIEFPGGGGNG